LLMCLISLNPVMITNHIDGRLPIWFNINRKL